MSTILPALIAVAGTLLGAGATFFIQRSATDRAASQAFDERLRQDRLNAYSTFADGVVEYRSAEYERWYRLRDGDETTVQEAKAAAHAKRAVARRALLRIALLTDDARLPALAKEAIDAAWSISRADDPDRRDEHGDHAKAALDAFIEQAAAQIQTPSTRKRLLSQRITLDIE